MIGFLRRVTKTMIRAIIKNKILKMFPILFLIGLNNASMAAYYQPAHIWGGVEYLYWWPQDSPISIPLITKNTNPSALGLIGEPGTQIIFGAGSNRDAFKFNGSNGARIIVGSWLDDTYQYGLEAVGFVLSKSKSTFKASSVGGNIPVVNIPFLSTPPASENVLVFKHPNTVTVSNALQIWGVELNALYNLYTRMRVPLVFLVGVRHINLSEELRLNDAILNIPSLSNSILNVRDKFLTKNRFNGFQMGVRSNLAYQKLVFDITALIGLGDNYQKLSINGQTNINNSTIIQDIGLFAEPSNRGSFTKHQFSIVPELRAKIGYKLSKIIQPYLTYNAFYFSNVIRPGKQIDRNINRSQNSLIGGTGVLSGPSLPSPHFNNTNMWIQGLSVGIELRF